MTIKHNYYNFLITQGKFVLQTHTKFLKFDTMVRENEFPSFNF